MDYPADGTEFELDNETVQLLYDALAGKPLTIEQRQAAITAIDYVSAARLYIEPEEPDEEITYKCYSCGADPGEPCVMGRTYGTRGKPPGGKKVSYFHESRTRQMRMAWSLPVDLQQALAQQHVQVVAADAEATADAHRLDDPGVDAPVDGHLADAQPVGDFLHGEQLGE